MTLIGRILVVLFGYAMACVAASIVLAVGMLTPEWDDVLALGIHAGLLGPAVGLGAAVVAVVAMLPALLLIALAEGFAWRSVVLYGALGGALALALSYGVNVAGLAGDAGFVREREVLAAAGIAGGFVYWLFAGRKAGLWKR